LAVQNGSGCRCRKGGGCPSVCKVGGDLIQVGLGINLAAAQVFWFKALVGKAQARSQGFQIKRWQ